MHVSADTALANMRIHDPESLTQALAATNHPLWVQFNNALSMIVGSQILADIAMRWLIGQTLNPLTPDDSRLQAEFLISRANL